MGSVDHRRLQVHQARCQVKAVQQKTVQSLRPCWPGRKKTMPRFLYCTVRFRIWGNCLGDHAGGGLVSTQPAVNQYPRTNCAAPQ